MKSANPRPKRQKRSAPESQTYEGEVLAVLAYEFSPDDREASDRKLKRRLREKKLGKFEAQRIEVIRAFHRDLLQELTRPVGSAFYRGATGEFSDMSDWNFDELVEGMSRRHPAVPRDAISGFMAYAIYLYYLR